MGALVRQGRGPARDCSDVGAREGHRPASSFDDSTEDNGLLRVLPGTHCGGVLTHDEIQRLASTVAPIACVAPAGGVVAMRPLVVHA